MRQKIKISKQSGIVSVVSALVGNTFITGIKFLGFFISGSSTMFSEAVHSAADTMNQALLLIGLRRSSKKPSEGFAYGHGKERFIWALMSACGIFILGSGVTLYHGIEGLVHPEVLEISKHINIIFLILLISLIIEGATFVVALRELHNSRTHANTDSINDDPTTLAVVYEDGAAVIGVFIALVSTTLAYMTGNYVWDSVGSILIGLLLGVMAVILIQKNMGYLIERPIPLDVQERVIEILESDPMIDKVISFKSSVLDIDAYRVTCDVEFNGEIFMKEISSTWDLKQEYENVKENYGEFIKFSSQLSGVLPRMIGKHINSLEAKVQSEIPEILFIDLEIN